MDWLVEAGRERDRVGLGGMGGEGREGGGVVWTGWGWAGWKGWERRGGTGRGQGGAGRMEGLAEAGRDGAGVEGWEGVSLRT